MSAESFGAEAYTAAAGLPHQTANAPLLRSAAGASKAVAALRVAPREDHGLCLRNLLAAPGDAWAALLGARPSCGGDVTLLRHLCPSCEARLIAGCSVFLFCKARLWAWVRPTYSWPWTPVDLPSGDVSAEEGDPARHLPLLPRGQGDHGGAAGAALPG